MRESVTDESGLTQSDFSRLANCFIPLDQALAAGLFRVDEDRAAEMLGRRRRSGISLAGIAYPYFLPNGSSADPHIREYRVRRDSPDVEIKHGTPKEVGKYLSPPGRSSMFYFTPGVTADMLKDASIPILFVEGEAKALASARAATKAGITLLVIGIPGVWCWKTTDHNGVKKPIQDFELVEWNGRKVTILYDRDVNTNPSVMAARTHLGNELRSRSCLVYVAEMPDGPEKGIDDLLGRIEREQGTNAAVDAFVKVISEFAEPDGLSDFVAFLPDHKYIYRVTRELWPASTINSRIGKRAGMLPSQFLDIHNAVQQMSWLPGEPEIIDGRVFRDGGWIEKKDARCFNLYRKPLFRNSDAEPDIWLEHITKIYPEDAGHIVKWMAHRVQRPREKLNHALVLGGGQGIGKDSLLAPLRCAVGYWNFAEISPHQLLGRFNGWSQSVVLRISEARDLGDIDRYQFYDRLKTYTTAPPEFIRIDEKNVREYSIPNVCGVIITTNYVNGLFLPSDDRRHYIAWSERVIEDFKDQYWRHLHQWFADGGQDAVAKYLREIDLSDFDPKAPPPRTEAWKRMVDSGRAPEDAELADTIDKIGHPPGLTLDDLRRYATDDFRAWLDDRRNRRVIPRRLEAMGYLSVHNRDAKDGFWKIQGRRQPVYAKRELSEQERIIAAEKLR